MDDFAKMSKMHPTISIVTPSLNQGRYIAETIESVILQAGNFYIDYIVVDACSSDDTIEIIKRYEVLLASGSWQVNCLGINFRWLTEKDRGQSDGINKGFHLANGDLFGWLNSDDLYSPGTLQKVAEIDWKRFDFCFGDGLWIDKYGEDLERYPTFQPNMSSLYYHCTLCQPTVFFSSKSFSTLGDLSLDYDLVFDYEYWLRAVFRGMKFLRIETVLAKSRMYQENKSLHFPLKGAAEKRKLLEIYYNDQRLNPLLSFYWKRVVNNQTNKKNEALTKKLKDIF